MRESKRIRENLDETERKHENPKKIGKDAKKSERI